MKKALSGDANTMHCL